MSETRERADHRASASSSSSWFSLGPFPERVVSRHYVVDLDPPRSAIPRRVRARFDERSRKSARSSVDRSHARERRPRRGRSVREVRMRFVNSKRRLVLFRRDWRTDGETRFRRRREGSWTSICAKREHGKIWSSSSATGKCSRRRGDGSKQLRSYSTGRFRERCGRGWC